MTEEGLDVEVWYCSDESIRGEIDKGFETLVKWDIPLLEGYPFRFFRNYSWKPSIYSGFWGLINLGILKELVKTKKSIVWVHGWANFINIATIIFAKLRGNKVFLRGENPLNQELLKSGTNRLIKKVFLQYFLFKLIDNFLYIGKQNKAFYKYYGVKEDQFIFAPYSVDNDRFQRAALELLPRKDVLRKELGLPVDAKIILYSGKYLPKKRPMDLLKAYQLLTSEEIRTPQDIQHFNIINKEAITNNQNKNPKSNVIEKPPITCYALVMAGDGALRPQIERYISETGLRNVFLTGFINQSDIVKYYAIADVFVMCSDQGETWGLSVNEAMNFDLPLVVSDLTGCASDLVTESTGLIFQTGNIKELAGSIKSIFGNKTGSQVHIKNFSYQQIVKNIYGATGMLR